MRHPVVEIVPREHPQFTSAKWLGGWGQKNDNFCWRSVLFMLMQGGQKEPKMCWRNTGMVPNNSSKFREDVTRKGLCYKTKHWFSKKDTNPIIKTLLRLVPFLLNKSLSIHRSLIDYLNQVIWCYIEIYSPIVIIVWQKFLTEPFL